MNNMMNAGAFRKLSVIFVRSAAETRAHGAEGKSPPS
jgi:hypothetical protein